MHNIRTPDTILVRAVDDSDYLLGWVRVRRLDTVRTVLTGVCSYHAALTESHEARRERYSSLSRR